MKREKVWVSTEVQKYDNKFFDALEEFDLTQVDPAYADLFEVGNNTVCITALDGEDYIVMTREERDNQAKAKIAYRLSQIRPR